MSRKTADFEHRAFQRGKLMIHTWHVGRHSLDMEIAASKSLLAKGHYDRIEWRDTRSGSDQEWQLVPTGEEV